MSDPRTPPASSQVALDHGSKGLDLQALTQDELLAHAADHAAQCSAALAQAQRHAEGRRPEPPEDGPRRPGPGWYPWSPAPEPRS
jgi:hypothetical protein